MLKVGTWDEWAAAGYSVVKGQRSTGRDHCGVATFTRDQVTKMRPRRGYVDYDSYYSDRHEDDDRFYGLGHDDW